MSGYAFEIYIKIDGKPSYPAICVLVGGFTNLILDYIFVVIFHYGVGAATGISQITSCTMLLFYIFFNAKHIKLKKLVKINSDKIFKIFKTGFSEFLTKDSKKSPASTSGR